MDKYHCNTCDKKKLPDPSTLKVGDKVNFTVQTLGRKQSSFKSKQGVITAIDGEHCSVESGSQIHVLKLENITPADAPSPLAYIFGHCECEVV